MCQSFIMGCNLYYFIFQGLSNRVRITVWYRRSRRINRFDLLCSNAGKLGYIVLVFILNILKIASMPFTYHLKHRKVHKQLKTIFNPNFYTIFYIIFINWFIDCKRLIIGVYFIQHFLNNIVLKVYINEILTYEAQ